MLEEQTRDGRAWGRPRDGFVASFIKSKGRRLLDWEPDGAVLAELPSGRQVRFGRAGVEPEALLKLHNYRVIARSLGRGSIGFAESYVDGDIDCSDLTELFRFFLRNRERFETSGRGWFKARSGDRIGHQLRRNSRPGSRRNISEHYDLGNDFFRPWLDPEMIYSSGYYEDGAATLEEAQSAKLALVTEFLQLTGGENVLEIGSGWGALARHMACNGAARVTGITLSHEQLAYAREHSIGDGAGQGGSCQFELCDYRDVTGQFDRIVAIEMIEAVGERYWPRFFQTLNDRLVPGGSAVIQAITIDEARFDAYRRKADFIQRCIFPGGMLPTVSVIARQAAAAGMRLERSTQFGTCYARTLREWRRRFELSWPRIAALGFDESFRRRWLYYLSYCEAGFLEGAVDVGVYRLVKARA